MRAAIITHYYKSKNYGGNLQAYALCKVLQSMGADAEQLSLNRNAGKGLIKKIKKLIKKILHANNPFVACRIRARNKTIDKFNSERIPHSRVYTEKNISGCVDDYDVFITGSDQVWHPMACCDAYLLNFVPVQKAKISYAASMATTQIPANMKRWYEEALQSFDAISVRETDAVTLLAGWINRDVEVHLDPTLLLSNDEWNEILENHGINEEYVFCYFLGNSQQQRRIVTEYAKKHGLKIVTLPHLSGYYQTCDKKFGDYRLYDVSPGKFLSLIKGATHVFTDSFHATVFSIIYEKQFHVFPRSGAETMSVRLTSLLELFDLQERFCCNMNQAGAGYIEASPMIDYHRKFHKYETAKIQSFSYLRKWISRPKEF